MYRLLRESLFVFVLAAIFVMGAAVSAAFADEGATCMYRLYNPNSGEHFYTGSLEEAKSVQATGWSYEGIGWLAPERSNAPVYRLYNPNAGDHHYTTEASEKDMLESVGWNYEGIGWYSSDARSVTVFREYNPNAIAGAHNFTVSSEEDDALVSVGWSGEGIAWYALKNGTDTGEEIIDTQCYTIVIPRNWRGFGKITHSLNEQINRIGSFGAGYITGVNVGASLFEVGCCTNNFGIQGAYDSAYVGQCTSMPGWKVLVFTAEKGSDKTHPYIGNYIDEIGSYVIPK